MIRTLLRVGWLNLKRDRVSQALTFLLPIVFFSIFALVFGNQGRDATSRIRVAVVDEDGSALSGRLVGALKAEKGLRVMTEARPAGRSADRTAPLQPIDRVRATELVRYGSVPVAVILPKGLGGSLFAFGDSTRSVELLADVSDPIAPQVVNGLLQKVAMTAAPDILAEQGFKEFEKFGGPMTPEQRRAIDGWLPLLRPPGAANDSGAAGDSGSTGTGGPGIRAHRPTTTGPGTATAGPDSGRAAIEGLVPVRLVDVLGEQRKRPLIAFYAAGIGVMFLLFSCAGAGGTLLEEAECGTLERLLSSELGMNRLLAGKWLYLTLLGVGQLSMMFTWGMLVFGLDLLEHLPGTLVMIAATAAAAAAFGLFLATLSRSRAQLSGYATILILVMSAIGGSMFPRFLMSETMQKLGLLTFNGWALDGFIKVFWRDAPLVELWPQVSVLAGLAAAFLALARGLARRWERV